MPNFRAGLLILVGAIGFTATPGAAQDAAPARCGGLLCDLGLFGGAGSEKTTLPCNDFVCRTFGGSRQAEAVPPPPAATPEPAPEKKAATKVRKKPVKVAKKEPAEIKPDAAEKK